MIALFVAAANLRPAIAAVSPLVDTIRADLGLSAVAVALLTTLPTLAMGACAPTAAALGRRLGLHRGVLIGLALITVATAARALGHSTWLQFSSATVAGVGIAVAQTLLPSVVRARFSDRAQLVTGIYTAGLGFGAVLAVAITVPISHALGSWPAALGSWAILAILGALIWGGAARDLNLSRDAAPTGPLTHGLPWRDRLAWKITAISAVNSAVYYCELAWIAPLLHEDAHRSTTSAAGLLTTMLVIQVIAMLTVPAALGERRDRRIGLGITSLLLVIGLLGLALSPTHATWVWIILIGVGHGGLFPLVLALPATMSRDAAHARQLSAMAFFIGYAAAAAAPLLVGALQDASGSFTIPFVALAVLAALITIPVLSLRRLPAGRD